MSDVLVLGCGLIGTSVGLALREADRDVLLHDAAPAVVQAAVARGAGRAWDRQQGADLVVVAVPPRATAAVLLEAQNLAVGRTFTHVASIQSHVQREVEALGCDMSSIVGGHPLAGRETSGPGAATADLFVGRPWALCPSEQSSASALEAVRALVADCGADAVVLGAEEHDASVALLSHLPQVASSALAGGLTAGAGSAGSSTRLAGPGLVDTTRLAASDPDLWCQVLELNATHVAPLVRALAARLDGVAAALDQLAGATAPGPREAAAARLRGFLLEGNAGRALVPVKRGALSDAFAPVRVSVRDEPGRLAALLSDAGAAGVNVEDVHVEHVPGRPTGVIELLVRTQDVAALVPALRGQGWQVLERD
jgi:prephenate dehydrogenase